MSITSSASQCLMLPLMLGPSSRYHSLINSTSTPQHSKIVEPPQQVVWLLLLLPAQSPIIQDLNSTKSLWMGYFRLLEHFPPLFWKYFSLKIVHDFQPIWRSYRINHRLCLWFWQCSWRLWNCICNLHRLITHRLCHLHIVSSYWGEFHPCIHIYTLITSYRKYRTPSHDASMVRCQ